MATKFDSRGPSQCCQALAADPGHGCQLQVMRSLQVIEREREREKAVMDQGLGRRSCEPATLPRLGCQPIFLERRSLASNGQAALLRSGGCSARQLLHAQMAHKKHRLTA